MKNDEGGSMKVMTVMMLGCVCLVAACSRNEPELINIAPPPAMAGVFVTEAPSGTPVPIPEARNTFKPGDSVLLEGRIMGVRDPFVASHAVFILGDNGTITPCTEMGDDDHCQIPWDACCDPIEVRSAGTATIQVPGADGNVIAHGLKGVGGLKVLSRVTVSGVVDAMSSSGAFVVNAKAIFVGE